MSILYMKHCLGQFNSNQKHMAASNTLSLKEILPDCSDETHKRRRIMADLDIQKQTIEVEASRAQCKITLMQTYQSLCPGQVMDDTARNMFKDQFLKMALGDYKCLTSATTNTEDEAISEKKHITVNIVASEMDLVLKGNDAQNIEATLKQMYFDRYQRDPAKHEQMVGGVRITFNSYAERDKSMIRDAICCYFGV